MKKFVSAVLLMTVVLSVMSMSACGDKNETSQNNVSVTENGIQSSVVVSKPQESSQISWEESKIAEDAITSEKIGEMQSALASCQYMPGFHSQGSYITAKSVSNGKVITLITDNLDLSYSKLVAEQFKVAAESAGFAKYIVAKTSGTETSINNALNSAVNDKSDVIFMFGNINKDTFATNIEYAQANGIEVVSVGGITAGKSDHFSDYTMPVDYARIGQYLADWAIVKTKGKTNVLAVNRTDSLLSNTVAVGFKNEFDEHISGVTGYCKGISATSAEIGNSLTDKIVQALRSDGNLNYIVVLDDTMIEDAVSAVEQLGLKIPIISTGGSDEAFDSVRYDRIEMLIGQSYEWTAYGMVDYALRLIGGIDMPSEQYVPFRILTSETIANAIANFGGLSGNFNRICFGSEFEYGYGSLWNT